MKVQLIFFFRLKWQDEQLRAHEHKCCEHPSKRLVSAPQAAASVHEDAAGWALWFSVATLFVVAGH